jgi:hypothetical protein
VSGARDPHRPYLDPPGLAASSLLSPPTALPSLLVMTEASSPESIEINDALFCPAHLKEVVRLVSSPMLTFSHVLTITLQCAQCGVDQVRTSPPSPVLD